MTDKYEDVRIVDLNPGDKIIARSRDSVLRGSVSHNLDSSNRVNMVLDGGGGVADLSGGWNFQRLIPERVLPTEPGFYVSKEAWSASPGDTVIYQWWDSKWGTDFGGVWVAVGDLDLLPDDLVMLVPKEGD